MVASGNSNSQQNLGKDVVCFKKPSSLGHTESSDDVCYSTGKDSKQTMLDEAAVFDLIRQHRHFCPWIASIGNAEPGWQQELSALLYRKWSVHLSPKKSPSSTSIIKVDDPFGSVRSFSSLHLQKERS